MCVSECTLVSVCVVSRQLLAPAHTAGSPLPTTVPQPTLGLNGYPGGGTPARGGSRLRALCGVGCSLGPCSGTSGCTGPVSLEAGDVDGPWASRLSTGRHVLEV